MEARKTALTEMIDSLTEEIEHLWGKNNEGRNPSLLTDEKRRLKTALVKEKRSLVEQRWQQVPPKLGTKGELIYTKSLTNLASRNA